MSARALQREFCPKCQDNTLFLSGKCQRTGCSFVQAWVSRRVEKTGRIRSPMGATIKYR